MSLFYNSSDVFHDSRSKNDSKYDVSVSRKANDLFVVTVPLFIKLVNRDMDTFEEYILAWTKYDAILV